MSAYRQMGGRQSMEEKEKENEKEKEKELKLVVYSSDPLIHNAAGQDLFTDKSEVTISIDTSWNGKQVAAQIDSEVGEFLATVQSLYLPAEITLPNVWEEEEPAASDPAHVVLNMTITAEADNLHAQLVTLNGELVEDIRFRTGSGATIRDVQQKMELQGWVRCEVLSSEGQHVFGALQDYTSLALKTCGKSEHRQTFEAARHAAKQLNELSDVFRSTENQVVVLRKTAMVMRAPMRVDVGVFGQHAGTPGQQWLESSTQEPLKVDVHELISKLGGQPGACFSEIQNLAISGLQEVKLHVDRAFESSLCHQNDKDDFKLSICPEKLVVLIGSEQFHKLLAIFGSRPDEILIRRCQAHGQCINFHLDHSFKTMQVALNLDEEYIGGRLVYATDSGLQVPSRSVGTVTLHRNDIVHGVTKLEEGIRYGLFFLDKSSKPV